MSTIDRVGRARSACVLLGVACASAMTPAALVRPDPAGAHVPITTSIVFKREIVPILQRACVHCHAAGRLAMPLTAYREARPWARAIREEILERRMPPWRAVDGHGRFANDIGLTARETDLIVAWIDGGAPSGMPKVEESTPSVLAASQGASEHGRPDIVRALEPPHTIQPGTEHGTARFIVSAGLTRARWLRGIVFDPDDRRLVRAASFYSAKTREWLGAWTPWHGATSLPADVAHRLAAGTRLLVEVHYRGSDEAASARSTVGLHFTDDRPAYTASNLTLDANVLKIPAKAARHRIRAHRRLSASATAFAVWPELGAGGASVEVTALRPDGVVLPLLWIDGYRAEWPTPYIFQEPIVLPRGTTIAATAYFDNRGETPIATHFRVTLAAGVRSPVARGFSLVPSLKLPPTAAR